MRHKKRYKLPNKPTEPTSVGAIRPAIAVHINQTKYYQEGFLCESYVSKSATLTTLFIAQQWNINRSAGSHGNELGRLIISDLGTSDNRLSVCPHVGGPHHYLLIPTAIISYLYRIVVIGAINSGAAG